MTKKNGGNLYSVFSVVLIVGLWYLASYLMNAPIILPDPVTVFKDCIRLFNDKLFLANIVNTSLRALISFAIITVSGSVVGLLAGVFPAIAYFCKPFVLVFKATPVMSIILLAFIWFKTGTVPIFSAFLMAFPVMYVQTLHGVKSLDPKVDQMCKIYNIRGFKRFFNFVFPSVHPYLITGAKQSLSMIWKVVIAAEVITFPKYGVGRGLQYSQMQLETSMVFAWTIVAVLLTAVGDTVFDLIIKWSTKHEN